MIKKFVDRFMGNKEVLEIGFRNNPPQKYIDIVKAVIEVLASDDGDPDPTRIHQIDDGGYQGTLVFVIAASGHQPSTYWYVRVGYGSCSGCDELEAIGYYGGGEPPTYEQISDYMTIALRIVQQMKQMDDVFGE